MKTPEINDVIVVLNFKSSTEKLEGIVWTVVEITKIEDNNIYFQEQYSFNDCKNKLPLKFDFMLEDDSGRIVLIEYDGEFHYNNIYGNLHQQQKRDKIKDDYCDNHDNIDLYRISYKEFNNIETILNEIINSYE